MPATDDALAKQKELSSVDWHVDIVAFGPDDRAAQG
jgi:hypothetical protein